MRIGAARAKRQGPRIRRPGAFAGAVAFAALAVGVLMIPSEYLPQAPASSENAAAPTAAVVEPPRPPAQPAPAGSAPPLILRGQTAQPTAAAPAEAVTPPPGPTVAVKPPAGTPTKIQKSAPPAVVKPPAPAVAVKAPAPETPASKASAAATAGVRVQIGAFPSQVQADGAWRDVAAHWPRETAGKRYETAPTPGEGKRFYRAQVVGFSTRAEAQAFCARLMAASRACFVK